MAKKINYTGSSKVIQRLCEAVNDLIDHGGGGGGGSADSISYDNTTSQLDALNVQDAIDEIAEDFQDGCDVIVSAVTAKGQTPASNSPEDIAIAIGNISGGGSLGTKTITANGTYRALDDNLDGYSIVTVNVLPRRVLTVYALDGEIHVGIKPETS